MSQSDRPSVQFFTVESNQDGQRLDNFLLSRLKGVPKSLLYRLIRKGEIRVNKGRVKPERKLVSGEVVRVAPIRTAQPGEAVVPSQQLQALLRDAILYDDTEMMVVDKPAGLAVHGGSGISLGAIEALRSMFPHERGLELVHRLDRDTSGCLLLAKKRAVLKKLQQQIQHKDTRKRYLALVKGKWPKGKTEVNAPLLKNQLSSGERVVRTDAAGKASLTLFEVVQTFAEATLVGATLMSGRTHQIRVHAQCAGHPLAGDEKYGDADFNAYIRNLGGKRMFLHAAELAIVHPVSGEPMTFEAPLPAELAQLLEKL